MTGTNGDFLNLSADNLSTQQLTIGNNGLYIQGSLSTYFSDVSGTPGTYTSNAIRGRIAVNSLTGTIVINNNTITSNLSSVFTSIVGNTSDHNNYIIYRTTPTTGAFTTYLSPAISSPDVVTLDYFVVNPPPF